VNSESRKIGAVFLDRDGTVSEEVGYMYDVSLYKVFPWTGPAIRRINGSGLHVILATNQSGIARGHFIESMVHRVHEKLGAEIAQAGARLDAAYFCPHLPDACTDCRKPNPGMLYRARDEMGISLEESYIVGDRYTDVQTGKAAGVRTVLVMTGDGRTEREEHRDSEIQPDYFAENLAEAAEQILKDHENRRRATLDSKGL
jgi:D-glycero-D-manno-heptose 1,7-bisphosphate phosphatase